VEGFAGELGCGFKLDRTDPEGFRAAEVKAEAAGMGWVEETVG